MPGDSGSELSFEALDALLDEALSLDVEALRAFLGELGDAQRDAVLALLAKSRSDALDRFGTTARSRIRDVAEAADTRNETAGSWRLMREIGSGGTGQVFYAERHEQSDGATGSDTDGFVQRAAVKVLWSHRVLSQFRDRFLRERRILASIDHPGLARFLDGGLLADGRPWFAMEYVEGDDIVSVATKRPIGERLEMFLTVADTIEYAHRRLIVHRDIKPQNVLVDALGHPRVLDFGIARIMGEFDDKELTRGQGAPITLQYASPEQVIGGSIDVASDVYQLGLLLYEMLAARRPYDIDEASLQRAIELICGVSPLPPSTYVAAIDPDLDAIVGQALRKEPDRRYPSAAAMAEDVRRHLDGRPVMARPHSMPYILSRFVRRHALPVGVIAASLVALAAATVFSARMALQARAEADRSQATQQILADVFQQADPFSEGGANISLAEALVRAKPSIEEKISGDPRLAWQVNKTLADIFTSLDLLDLEKGAYQAAWDAALELGGNNQREVLLAIAGLGNILARTDPAEAVEFFAKNLPPAPSTRAAAQDWLSAKYAEVGSWARLRDYQRADEGAREMARVADAFHVESPRTLGRINQLLAGAARRAGDIEAADAHWIDAVEYMRLAEKPAGHAVTLSNMALHYGMTGRYEESEAAFREAISIFRKHDPDNTSHANILRSYAGLLFRMRRPEEALAMLGEGLSILDRDEQSYPYFVTQLDRAIYAFAADNMSIAFEAIDQGFDVALSAFGAESDVTQRMSAVFARLLQFADREADAARLVGIDEPQRCASDNVRSAAIDDAVRVLADAPAVEEARQAVQESIGLAQMQAGNGTLDTDALADVLAVYRNSPNVFLDALDRWRMLNAFADVARTAELELPVNIQSEHERLASLRIETQGLLAVTRGARVEALLIALRPGFDSPCVERSPQPVVSEPVPR